LNTAYSLSPETLRLDPYNPRLVSYNFDYNTPEEKILCTLWEEEHVRELADSIAANSYWRHEPLIITNEQGHKVVIEGNRRLAAAKALLNPVLLEQVKATELAPPSAECLQSLETLPVIEVPGRFDAWRFIGYKHVSGPVRWSSIAKAKYIYDLYTRERIELTDIAKQLGDSSRTVLRLFHAYSFVHQVESARLWFREDRAKPRLAFSHLMTGLDYPGFQTFLGLNVDTFPSYHEVVLEYNQLETFADLCKLLWGSKSENLPSVIRSQNPDLRRLDKVLQGNKSTEVILRTRDLNRAIEATKSDMDKLLDSLLQADDGIGKALDCAPYGYLGDEENMQLAESIYARAEALHAIMGKKRREAIASLTNN
jgi:hypothetical protein